MADDKLREAALKPIATIKKPVIAAEKKEETTTVETAKEETKTEKKATAKKTAAKKAPAKKTATKAAAEKKEEAVKAEEPKVAEKKTTAKKTATKAAEKKPATKKAAAKKEDEVKSTIVLQYADIERTYSTLVDNAKAKFQNEMGGKVSDIKTLDIYVKPEEYKVYFVINGDINGECDL